MLPARPDPLGEVAAPKPRKPAKRPRKEPTATLPGKGSRQSHAASAQSRKAPWRSDVVRAKVRPLTPKQRTWLLREASAAWKHQRSVSRDDRSFDVFRHDVIAEATAGHHAGQVDGLTKATDRHFDCLMAAFLVLQGKRGDALKWAEKDDPEAQRLDHTRHLIRELLKKSGDLPHAQMYADTFARRLYGKDWERLDADQADYFYRQIKPLFTKELMAKRAEAWLEKQKEEAV